MSSDTREMDRWVRFSSDFTSTNWVFLQTLEDPHFRQGNSNGRNRGGCSLGLYRCCKILRLTSCTMSHLPTSRAYDSTLGRFFDISPKPAECVRRQWYDSCVGQMWRCSGRNAGIGFRLGRRRNRRRFFGDCNTLITKAKRGGYWQTAPIGHNEFVWVFILRMSGLSGSSIVVEEKVGKEIASSNIEEEYKQIQAAEQRLSNDWMVQFYLYDFYQVYIKRLSEYYNSKLFNMIHAPIYLSLEYPQLLKERCYDIVALWCYGYKATEERFSIKRQMIETRYQIHFDCAHCLKNSTTYRF